MNNYIAYCTRRGEESVWLVQSIPRLFFTLLLSFIVRLESSNPLLRCYDGYRFSNGDTEVTASCVEGEWVVPVSHRGGCDPICPTNCANGGVCVAPLICSCQEGFVGKWCEERACLQPIEGNNFSLNNRWRHRSLSYG